MRCPDCFQMVDKGECCPHCGFHDWAGRNKRALEFGTMLNQRYIVGRVLGEGGFGITYKVYDIRSGQILAVKEYAPTEMAARRSGTPAMEVRPLARRGEFLGGMEAFIEEANILKRLAHIPEVVTVWDCFREFNTAYFVMEFLDGKTLNHMLKEKRETLSFLWLNDMISRIGMTLDRIHKEVGIIHRDVSPENIFILKNKEVKLFDFGSARDMSKKQPDTGTITLKPAFAPPEQFSRQLEQGSYTDVYALAGTYYYALSGVRLPTALERLDGRGYLPLKDLSGVISQQLSDNVDRALELEADHRLQNMMEFVEGINEGKLPVRNMIPCIIAVAGANTGKLWKLQPDKEVKLGRSAALCRIAFPEHQEVSSEHCLILYDRKQEQFFIMDNSRNGTFVNGEKLPKGQWLSIGLGSSIALASISCVVTADIRTEE